MNKPSTPHVMLILSDQRTGGHLVVHLEAFVQFSRTIDRDLRRLVAKWGRAAAPGSERRAVGGWPRKPR